MNKKGFTLIELLAVILVIGIVAVITVPIVKGSINNAKEKTLMKQTSSIIESAKSWAVKNTDKLLGDGVSILVKVDTLKKEGYLENKTITDPVDNVEMNGCVDIKYNASYNQYEYEYRSSCEVANSIFTTASDGTEVPACITDNTPCDVTAAGDDGIKVGVKVNDTKTYDFYVMSDNTSKNKITLLMSENLGGTVAWITKEDYLEAGGTESDWDLNPYTAGNNNKGPITAFKTLEERTSGWTNISLETYQVEDGWSNNYSPITRTARARIITAQEALDAGCINNYYDPESEGPKWFGIGYWTSTAGEEDFDAWTMDDYGEIDNAYNVSDENGIRPVITISKMAPIY